MTPLTAHAPEVPSRVARLLVRLVAAVCRYPGLVLAVAALLCVASAWLFSTRLSYRTQRTDLVHPDKDYQRRWQRYLDEFGDDDDMVVVVQGGEPPVMRDVLEVVELAPYFDVSQMSIKMAANMIYHYLGSRARTLIDQGHTA